MRAAGCSASEVDEIEEIMRAVVFQSTLDWQTRDEIEEGARRAYFLVQCEQIRATEAVDLGRTGRRTDVLLTRAASEPRLTAKEQAQLKDEIDTLPARRRAMIQEVRRHARQYSFREQVLRAYGRRCAVSGVPGRLVEAAHILPVGARGSVDHVRNGIALSPVYYSAFVHNLVYIDETFTMRINPAQVRHLGALGLLQGLDTFRAPLGKILLPPDKNQWPDARLIRRANVYRQIPAP